MNRIAQAPPTTSPDLNQADEALRRVRADRTEPLPTEAVAALERLEQAFAPTSLVSKAVA